MKIQCNCFICFQKRKRIIQGGQVQPSRPEFLSSKDNVNGDSASPPKKL